MVVVEAGVQNTCGAHGADTYKQVSFLKQQSPFQNNDIVAADALASVSCGMCGLTVIQNPVANHFQLTEQQVIECLSTDPDSYHVNTSTMCITESIGAIDTLCKLTDAAHTAQKPYMDVPIEPADCEGKACHLCARLHGQDGAMVIYDT